MEIKKKYKKKMDRYKELRFKNQPLEYPSAGSIFKKPENKYAGRLIEESNLKGESIGGAEVSTKHAGFIINTGNAKAMDIYKLMERIKADVKIYHNVLLEPEIKLWGKF